MAKGDIPKNLFIATKPLEKHWRTGVETIPAFAVDGDKLVWVEKAKSWAEGQYTKQTPGAEYCRENVPTGGFRLVSIESRDEGGRAYKMVSAENFLYDLREDQVWATMVQTGILPGAILPGEYVIGRVGSQMKWVLVGSELYKELGGI